MPPKRQAAAEGAGSPAPAPTVAEPEPAEEELQPEPAAAPAATAEEGTPEPSLVSPSGAGGGQYGPIMRRRLKKFLAIVEADEGWEDRGEVTYRVPDGSDAILRHWGRAGDVLMIRFSGEIAAPAAAVWDIIRDGSRRSELDELFDQSRKLEDLSPLISVWQFDFKPVMMTAPRSFVTIGFSVKLPDGRLVCFSFSVDHPDASDPESTGHVRADLGVAGYLIEPLENSKCKLTVVMRLDLGGSLMDWIREKAAKDQHENMGSLAAGLLGPNAARSLEAYVASGEGESAAIPNAPDSSQEAYAQLEALGKALLDEGSPESLKAEQESLAEWEIEKDASAATETIADSVGSFMKSLW